MEPLPPGANFQRAAVLWEAGLHIAGKPDEPYGGNRDVCITVGSGAGQSFRPWLSMATGSADLAHAVANGEVDMAFINPSGLLTQAYRGTGMFSEPLPIRVVASYPSLDMFVIAVDPKVGITSLAEIKERKLPLRLSIREDITHSTRVLIDQMFAELGFSMDDIVAWGGELKTTGGPGHARRLDPVAAHEVDMILDEGIRTWLSPALSAGYQLLTPDPPVLDAMVDLGWRRSVLPAGSYPGLDVDHTCIDFSGWPIYTRESLPDEVAYAVCDALSARTEWIPWGDRFMGVEQLVQETDATPLDVPLHPGTVRWLREHTAMS